MDCSICSLPFPSRGQPTCASCARALVYHARLERVTDLLANESLRDRVHRVLASPTDPAAPALPAGSGLVEVAESRKKHAHDRTLCEAEAARLRCAAVEEQLALLRRQIGQAATDRDARRLDMDRRRSALANETAELERRVPQLLDPLHTTIRRTQRRLDRVYARTVEGRIKLCQEMARLAGLQQRRRRMPDGRVVQDYTIGSMPIFDLRELNAAPPDLVTASLANICRLLTTCCHYLSVRLPAEITPPHANHPHPTIFSLQSSYQGFHPPFPGAPSSNPSSSHAQDQRSAPKPRLLHLDRPLVALAKEDASRYNLFVEGVSLLAWDICYLCATQGLDTAPTHPSISPLGRNLYTLFREATRRAGPADQTAATNTFGRFSHAGARLNLAAAEGADVMRGWRAAASWTRFLDRVKQTLFHDMSGAEWEVISGDDFDHEREDERPVLVGGAARASRLDDAKGARRGGAVASEGDAETPVGDDGKGYLVLKSRA